MKKFIICCPDPEEQIVEKIKAVLAGDGFP